MNVIVIDVDGTLVKKLSDPSYQIKKVLFDISKNSKIILMTGRPFQGIQSILFPFQIDFHAVVLNGASIFISKDVSPKWKSIIPPKKVKDIIDYAWQDKKLIINGFTFNKWYTRFINEFVEHERKLIGVEPIEISYNDFCNLEFLKISLVFEDEESLERFQFKMPHNMHLEIVRSNINYLEITAENINKGIGLIKLFEELGWDFKSRTVISIGDGENDIPVFKISKHSIAMGSANKLVKEEAKEVLNGDSDNELVKVLSRYIY